MQTSQLLFLDSINIFNLSGTEAGHKHRQTKRQYGLIYLCGTEGHKHVLDRLGDAKGGGQTQSPH